MKVSVIVPCYNVEKYIGNCLLSLEKQTYTDLEVICVDDGSTDNTPELIRAWLKTTKLNASLIEQKNSGAPAARNAGIAKAKGEYFQFLDADDILKPEKITAQIGLAEKCGFPDLIAGSYLIKAESGEIIKTRAYTGKINDYWKLLLEGDLGITSANLFKAAAFRNGIRWDDNLHSSQEAELMFHILKNGAAPLFDSAINTIILRRPGSISKTDIGRKWERYVQLRLKIIEFLKSQSLIEEKHYGILFDALRMLYPHNPEKAVAYYRRSMPSGFLPKASGATSSGYVALFRFLGFEKTEKIRRFFRREKAE